MKEIIIHLYCAFRRIRSVIPRYPPRAADSTAPAFDLRILVAVVGVALNRPACAAARGGGERPRSVAPSIEISDLTPTRFARLQPVVGPGTVQLFGQVNLPKTGCKGYATFGLVEFGLQNPAGSILAGLNPRVRDRNVETTSGVAFRSESEL